MNNTMNQVDYVAIYAAIISTIALIWNIINSIIEKSSRLVVDVSFHENFISIGNGNPIAGPKCIKVSIVNKSKKIKYIKSINIKLPYSTQFGNMANLYKVDSAKRIEIKPEEEYILDFNINSTAEWMFENYKDGKFKIVVYDTTNKQYKSKKKNIKVFRDMYESNKKLPKEVWSLINN